MKPVKVHFLGAAGTVTGSKFLIETQELNIMIDCGVFQGLKELREQNWVDFPFDPEDIDMVLLTHGHLDHTGYLPRLVKQGFHGQVLATAPTLAITEIILLDSAKIHEEEAEKANKERYSRHHPALPFYTIREAELTLSYFRSIERDTWIDLSQNIKCRFRYNGHIIGATFIELEIGAKRFVFSGDIGRPVDLLLNPPDKPRWADYLFLESTYGNKHHQEEDVDSLLIELINDTIYDRGNLIIPSFAVERMQTIVYMLWKLYQKNKIPNIPVFVDSPMGRNVLSVFERFPEWHNLPLVDIKNIYKHMNIITSYKETWETIDNPQPKIVIAGSGMVTGGRVLTYLKQLIDEVSTRVLLVGFQAEGTRGRQLLEGAHEIKFFGKYHAVKAKLFHLESLSAHSDQAELLNWLSEIKNVPEQVFLIHGEPSVSASFQTKLQSEFRWHVQLPQLGETVELMV